MIQQCAPLAPSGSAPTLTANESRPGWSTGVGGPLRVSDPVGMHPLLPALVEACQEVGLARNPDFNGDRQDGTGYYQYTIKDRRRHSAYAAFVRPVATRPNLTVTTDVLVTRVDVDAGRATGVSYAADGAAVQVEATREVIVSAGTINSPQLLMLSGIGPAEHLREHGIEVRADLPGVGGNLHDHPTAFLNWTTSSPVPRPLEYAFGGAFLRTGLVDQPAPDIQLHLVVEAEGQVVTGATVPVTLLRPRSRGRVSLRSTDPAQWPAIEFGYLTDPKDLTQLAAAVVTARRIGQTTAVKPFDLQETAPGPGVTSTADLEGFLRRRGRRALAPRRDLPHGPRPGRRRRPRAQSSRHRPPPRRRRLRHASDLLRQHQRARNHDRRKGRRTDAPRLAGSRLTPTVRRPASLRRELGVG